MDREPRVVTAAEALLDLDQAGYAFSQAYAGIDGRAPERSSTAVARAAAELVTRPSWEPDELARLLRSAFVAPDAASASASAFAPATDGHLAFGYGGHAPLRLATVAWHPPVASTANIPFFSGMSRVDPPSGYRLLSLELPPAEHLDRIETPPRSRLDSANQPPVELTREASVPVLAIRTFDSSAAPSLEALPGLASELRRAPAFVVDLRGNSGGNYLYAERFALALTDATVLRLDEREVISVAAAEGRANSVRRRLARGDIPERALSRFRTQLDAMDRSAAALRATRAPRADLVTRSTPIRGSAAGPLLSRAVLLVDRGCASACEMLLALARQIPGVLIAGENTRGGMSVGELALFQLSRSGITISLGTRAFHDPLGDFTEGRGFMPDVWLDGGDVLADATALAARR